jgi:hypothetical protein
MCQRSRIVALHLGQSDTRRRIALYHAVADGVVKHPPQNAERVAGGRG